MDVAAGSSVGSWARSYYARATVAELLAADPAQLYSHLFQHAEFDIVLPQRDAWISQLEILKGALANVDHSAYLFFEFSVPRVGKRIDAVLIINDLVIVIEFKVGADKFPSYAIDQVWDYALDLKNFHSESHDKTIIPILVATEAPDSESCLDLVEGQQQVYQPVRASVGQLATAISTAISGCHGEGIDPAVWSNGRYLPTPTIVEAARALYGGHSVEEISRTDHNAVNLAATAGAVEEIIHASSRNHQKSIIFVTGVPGAGKTLVGLDVATKHRDKSAKHYSVYLSGNFPLVKVLQEALARDKVASKKAAGERITLADARRPVSQFIQMVHHFRDSCLVHEGTPPPEHVALFDEAQRAWTHAQTASFMKRKKGRDGFPMSEPEFLISCMDRHEDWAVVVCLVGGGQEINTGEAGISEWIDAVMKSFPGWHVYVSPNLRDSEFGAGQALEKLAGRPCTTYDSNLHLSVSMRSFRAENVSYLVKSLLDLEVNEAVSQLALLKDRFPIVLTRDLGEAKQWVRERARGTQRSGIVVSSQAYRLRPLALDVRPKIEPVHWFLGPRDDVRSSWFLEEPATEFDVQGLELDWTIVVWDADFRHNGRQWENHSFTGGKWQRINAPQRKLYQKNAYRVLLTRARQGMVIVVPEGDMADYSRQPEFYDGTWSYLTSMGAEIL